MPPPALPRFSAAAWSTGCPPGFCYIRPVTQPLTMPPPFGMQVCDSIPIQFSATFKPTKCGTFVVSWTRAQAGAGARERGRGAGGLTTRVHGATSRTGGQPVHSGTMLCAQANTTAILDPIGPPVYPAQAIVPITVPCAQPVTATTAKAPAGTSPPKSPAASGR